MARGVRPVDKVALRAYVEACHNMNLSEALDSEERMAVEVEQTKASLAAKKSILSGLRQAIKEKKEALG